MKFSNRTAWDLEENDFARATRLAREEGRALLDLTVSNPTAAGFTYSSDLLTPLIDAKALLYEPDALGMARGREAVAEYYRDRGNAIGIDRICLTTSTSEAYSYLFRLLCDTGDEVLIARPSYPLFDFIARLDNVKLMEYPLLYNEGWHIDLAALEASITDRTRAIIVVHPNNPSGNFISDQERAAIAELCATRNLALIVDEVFLDYAWQEPQPRSFADTDSKALTFVLSGISKICGLPQMKVSWLVARGPSSLVEDSMQRLEVIADTFLSVNAPMQFALRTWLEQSTALQSQIRSRCAQNLVALDQMLVGSQVSRLHGDGGWTAVLRVPRGSFAEDALARDVLVQPGEFYGLPPGRCVVSLLTPLPVWQEGLARILSI